MNSPKLGYFVPKQVYQFLKESVSSLDTEDAEAVLDFVAGYLDSNAFDWFNGELSDDKLLDYERVLGWCPTWTGSAEALLNLVQDCFWNWSEFLDNRSLVQAAL